MAGDSSLTQRSAQWFSQLSERERRLVLLTAAVAAAIIVTVAMTIVANALDKRQKRVVMRRDEIAQLEALRDRYQEAVQTEARNKSRIATNTGALFSLLQKAAADVGITLTDLNERRAPVKDSAEVTEVTVDLTLKELTVDKLNTLLEKIEGRRNDGVVKVTKLKVKTRFDKPELLEATMTVATWKGPSSGAGTGSEIP